MALKILLFLQRGEESTYRFYKADCIMCEKIEPEFQYAASKYDESDNVLFGRVNGYKERKIVHDLGITSFPVFKWYKKGNSTAVICVHRCPWNMRLNFILFIRHHSTMFIIQEGTDIRS
jgi:hypothetical protein